ncbi:MAG: GreA/GreB family elongation factor [Candidatus Levybacteria bacterium]|nr:GreA/GreB family elongation factor [Candidatus Levybacteria bacterium]
MNNIIFTQTGVDDLKKEQGLLKVQRKEAVLDLKKARDMGDLSENGYYKAAKFKLISIDRRIRLVDHLLKSAIIPAVVKKETIDIGCTVTLDDGEKKTNYLLVGGYESDPKLGKLSVISPIGRAIVGKKRKDVIEIESPSGKRIFTIVDFVY